MSRNSRQDRTGHDSQIIVATGDLPVVLRALDALRISVGRRDEIRVLQLARLTLPRLAAEIRDIRADVYLTRWAESQADARRPRGTAPEPINDLDLLMFRLRFDFAYHHGGWIPEMGKNRFVRTVESVGEIGGGGITTAGEIGGGKIGTQGEIGGGRLPVAQGEIGGGGGPFQPDPPDNSPLINHGSRRGAGVRIAVLDTKIYRHREFRKLRHQGFAVKVPDGPLPVMAGHGTFGAGLILARAPQARIISVPVLDTDGQADVWTVARRIADFLAADARRSRPVDIVHMPWAAFARDGETPMVLATAIRRLAGDGRVLVAAAGNHGASRSPGLLPNAAAYPAARPEAYAVGALNLVGDVADFSPDPRTAPWLDIARPGVTVRSTFPGDTYVKWSGTSFAAARFTGELAAYGTGGRDIARWARKRSERWLAKYHRTHP